MNLDLIMIAITPGIALALLLYFTDRYDREPIRLLIKVFIWGGIITAPTILLERFLLNFDFIFVGILRVAYIAFIVAGFSEEFMKRLVVKKIAFNHPAFNEKLDGIIYASFAALGFATVENVIYVVFRYPEQFNVGIYRAFLSVPGHMLFAITMGYYLSLSKYAIDDYSRRYYYKKSLSSPVLLHGIYDFILMADIPLLMIGFVPFVLYLWITNFKKLNAYYRDSKKGS